MKVVINQKYLEGGFFPMKEFKKIIALVLAVMMLASVAVISASAEDAEAAAPVIRGTITGAAWDASADAANTMTATESGYTFTYENLGVGSYQFKVVYGGEWYGDENGANYAFEVAEACDVTITFDPETKLSTFSGTGVKAAGFDVKFVAAVGNANGDKQFLNGISWDPAAEANVMTETEKGVYTITFKGVAGGTDESYYEYKFACNGGWDASFGGSKKDGEPENTAAWDGKNLEVFAEYAYNDITLTLDISNFDFETKSGATYSVSVVEGEAPATEPASEEPTTAPATEEPTTAPVTEPLVVESAVVCGSANLCGEGNTGYGWDPSDTTNVMTKGDDGKYTLTKTLPAGGVYEFKVVVNGEKWIGDNNYKFNMKADGDVTITFDPDTLAYEATGEQVDVIKELTVDYVAAVGNSGGDKKFLNGIDWDPAAEANRMTGADGGTFVAFGEAFDAEYNAQGNIEFSTTYDYSDITLTLDLTKVDAVTRGGAVITITEVEGQAPATEPTSEPSTEEPQKPVVPGFYIVGSEEVLGVEWGFANVWETCVPMTEVEGSEGKIFTQTFENVPSSANASDDTGAPRYEFKVVYINDKGGVTWHPGGMGNNTYVTVEKDNSTLVFTFELLASRPTKEGEDPEAVVCEVIPPVEPTTEAPKPATTLTLKAAKTSIAYGATTTVKATVKNGVGKTTFKSSNTKVATVNAKGKVVAKGVGSAKITATNNKVSKTVTIKVVKAANPMKVSSKKAVTASKKKATTIKGVVKVSKAQGTVTYKTSNKKVTVNKKGALVVKKGLKKAVTVKVTVTAKGNKNYKSAKKVVSIKVNVK